MKKDIRITTDLDAVPNGSNCAVIIRHADRDGELNRIIRKDEGLNDAGIRRAEQFGSYLGRFSDIVAFTSPIGRCVDTCVHISKGFGKEVEPVTTDLLGMSAPFMVDPEGAYKLMKEVGLLNFVDSYVKDKLDRKMVLPCNEGLEMMLSYVIDKIENMDGGIGVFVTHDMIITPAMAYYFGYDFKHNGLAPFLDGLVLYEDGDAYTARYNGKKIRVSDSGAPARK